MSIFTLLLVSLLANVSTSILIVPCPFNIDDCSCVDPISNVEYAAATCTSENGQIPSFNGSGYSIDGALNVTFNAYWLSPGSFKAFDNIQRLGLIQPLGPAILRQTWQPGAFLGPNISGVQVSNLAGVVPPPDPLVEIASDLKELHFINCQESITLDGDAYSNFTSLRVLAFQDTHILRIDDNAFRGLEKTLGELYLQNASLIAYPTEALRDLKLLYRLDLSDSAIQDYQTFSFQRQIELAFLVLDGNNLRRAIDSGALSNLPPNLASLSLQRSDPPLVDMPTEVIQQAPKSLSVLSLAYNGFTDLMAGAFPSGSNLAALHLNGNPIVSIQAGALRPLSSLASLDLSQTQLTAFDLSLLDGMDSLVWVNLDDTYSLKTLLISHLSQVRPSRRPAPILSLAPPTLSGPSEPPSLGRPELRAGNYRCPIRSDHVHTAHSRVGHLKYQLVLRSRDGLDGQTRPMSTRSYGHKRHQVQESWRSVDHLSDRIGA